MADDKPDATKITPKNMEIVPGGVTGDEPLDTSSHEKFEAFTSPMAGDMSEEYQKILAQFRKRQWAASQWWRQVYQLAAEDVEFIYGDQWDNITRQKRQDRPSIQMNVLPKFINQVVGAAKRSKFSVQVDQTAGDTNPFLLASGLEKVTPAEVMDGMIRQVERRSFAGIAYCDALQHALEGGFGWLKVGANRRLDDPFNAELEIGYVRDRYSVLFDPYGIESPAYRDAMWCSEFFRMKREEFEIRYPEVPPTSFGQDLPEAETNTNYNRSFWVHEDSIRVTNYWFKHPMERTAVRFLNDKAEELVLFKDEHEDIFDELQEAGYQKVQEKKFKAYKIYLMRCVYDAILEGPFPWPSLYLPLIPVLGNKVERKDSIEYMSLTRIARDPMRMVNYWFSAMTEVVGSSPHDPYIMTSDQIAGYESMWKNMNDASQRVLVYNFVDGQSPPQRSGGSTLPTAELNVMLTAKEFIMDTIGMGEASLGQPASERTGVAVQSRYDIDSLSNHNFMSNIVLAVRQVGIVLCDMIPKVYSNDQARRLVRPDDTSTMVNLNHRIRDEESGREYTINNLATARYDCSVEVGPGTSTVRSEFVNMATELIKSVPQYASLWGDLIVQNMPMPNSREAARRARMMVPRELLSPEEQANMPEPAPTPEQQAEMAKAQADQAKSEADMEKAASDVKIAEINLDIAKVKLETEQIKAENIAAQGEIQQEQAAQQGGENAEKNGEDDEKKMERVAKRVMASERAGKK